MSVSLRKKAEIFGSDHTNDPTRLIPLLRKRMRDSVIQNYRSWAKRFTKQNNKKYRDAVDDFINNLTHLTPLIKQYFRHIIEESWNHQPLLAQNNISKFLKAKFNLKELEADANVTIS